MSQKSYGTITIIDTNDIARIYVVYAKSATNTDVPSAAASTWTESIATAPGSGDYIWQRTVTEQSGTHDLTYGNPVCVTGPQGGTGATGRGVSSIVTTYCNYGTGEPAASYDGWQPTVPTYDSTKPNYWVKTVITYTTGSPATDTSIYKDNGITDAIYNSAVANSIAQNANENAQGALSQAIETQYQTEALDAKLKYFFWPGDNNYPGVYAVSGIDGTTFNEGSISTYGYNVAIKPASISIGYNSIKAILIDGSNPSLKFYTPSKTTQASNPSMELSSTALVFNNPTTGQAQLTLSASGSLQSGNYSRGNDTKFAASGTKIDLTAGDIITQYFRLSQGGEPGGPNAGAYIHGTIEALDGRIGGYEQNGTATSNYWDIGNFTDYNLQRSAKMIGHGSSFIQLGDSSTWRLATNRIHTGWYISTDSYLHFPEFTNGSEIRRWDYGIHVPTSKGDKFLYIRNASSTTALSNLVADLEDTNTTHYWTYKFYIDGEGNLTTAGNITLTGRDSTTGIIDAHDVRIDGISIAGGSLIAGSLSSYGGSSKRPVYFPDSGPYQGKPLEIDITDNTSATAVASDDDKLITARTLYYAGYVKSSGITSITVAATSPVVSSTNTEQTGSSASTTISLANAYGDTKNPYGTKTKNYVLAGPENGSAAVPTFRALVAADIPDLSSIYLTSYTETDPTVPSWAKASSKPSYGLNEITGTDNLRAIEALTGTSGFLKKTNNIWSLDTTTYLTSSSTLNAAKLSGAIPSAVTATTQASTDNSTKIATTAYVTTAIANLPEPMIFKGSVGTSGTVTWANLATAVAANEGWTYKVITAHTAETGKPAAKVGDTIISNGSEWIVIPSGDEPSGTVTSVGLVNATNGGLLISNSPITTSGNITIGLDNNYGDTKNPYAVKDANKVLAGPSSGSAAVPSFRALVAADIPNLSWNKITSNKPTTLSGYGITDAAGSNALVGLEASSNAQGITTFTATRASGTDPLSFEVSITASSATGATKLKDSSGDISLGAGDHPVYFSGGVPAQSYYIPKLNGSNQTSAASFYAPTSAGTVNQVLVADTNGVPVWTNQSNITGKDEKMKWEASVSTNTYYPLQSTSTATTSTANTLNSISFYQYYNTAGGYRRLILGNSTIYTSTGGAYGTIRLYSPAATYYGDLNPGTIGTSNNDGHLTGNRTWTLPNDTGTIALTKNIPSIPTTTQNATTGVTASTTATKTTLGTAISITGVSGSTTVRGVKTGDNSTITASKASGANSTKPSLSYTARSVGSASGWSAGSFSATVTEHVLSYSYVAPTLTITSTACDDITAWDAGSASTWSFSDVTVPIRADSDTTVPKAASSVTSIPNVTGNTSATVSITDPGHSHSI